MFEAWVTRLRGTSVPVGDDDLANRDQLLRIGMLAVGLACTVFAGSRWWIEHSTGLRTPWWANFAGAVSLLLLYFWYRRAARARSEIAVHGTAGIATVALLVPVAYGMSSSKWWLSLVGFAVLLMGRRREALVWAPLTLVLVPLVALLEPSLRLPGSVGEPPLERAMAGGVFVALLLGMTGAFRRVARQRARELATTARSLERAAAVRTRFLARMSHDLRTPLHGVISMSEVALARATSPEGREPIEAARHSAGVLLGLLNNILDVTRAEAGAIELQTATFSIHNTLAQLLMGPAAEARAKGLTFEASAEPSLVELRVGDEARFAQIAMNLVSNALKFTSTGGVTVRLATAAERPDRVQLVVTDTGRGIPPDKLDRIFEPFEQADPSDAQRLGGVGLGLSIVKELTRLMSGSVSVQSNERGSTFAVELPLPRAVADGAPGPIELLRATSPEPGATGPQGPAHRILVCDDDPVGRRALCALLRLRGHFVVSASHATQALAELASADFDLLITDIEMPGMDGVALTREIREQERKGKPRLLIVAATAYASEDDARRLLAAGIDAHLAKPFTPQQLDRLVELTPTRQA